MGSTTPDRQVGTLLREVLKRLRAQTPACPGDTGTVAAADSTRWGWLDGGLVPRVTITLRSPGCGWVRQGGGCVMCGHFAGTTQGETIAAEDLARGFLEQLPRFDWGRYPILCLYNSGSLLNPAEVPDEALEPICRAVANVPGLRRVVMESRGEYATADRIRLVRGWLGDKEVEIALGLESADEEVRNLGLNKGFSLDAWKRWAEVVREHARLRVYLFHQPPWLTEREALDDTLAGIRLAVEAGAREIHIEPATIQEHTLLWLLWKRGEYRPPWLWSFAELLRRAKELTTTPIYLSPCKHYPPPVALPENCPACTARVNNLLQEQYNLTFAESALAKVSCGCQEAWRQALRQTDPRPYAERVWEGLVKLLGEMESQKSF